MLGTMLDRARRARSDESGFTLIELLIVIVILGVLAGIVVFAVGGVTDRGETSACKTTVKTVDTAVEAYYAKTGNYPASIAAVVTAGFLHDDPTASGYSSSYSVSYTPATHDTAGTRTGGAAGAC